jgi:hypothetical protein
MKTFGIQMVKGLGVMSKRVLQSTKEIVVFFKYKEKKSWNALHVG